MSVAKTATESKVGGTWGLALFFWQVFKPLQESIKGAGS